MGIFLFHQFQVVGRALPILSEEHSKIYLVKRWEANEVRAQSKFWKMKKVKVNSDIVLAINKMCGFRGRRKHFDMLMVPQKASVFAALYPRLQTFFGTSQKKISLNISSFQRKVQKVTCWKEKFILYIGSLFSCLVVTIILIISESVTVSKAPTWALTEDNRLFLEAWRIVDRAYFDKTFNGQSWFRYRENALRTEPMNNREETYRAIKKMISTLDDPFTRFLEPEKFRNLRAVWHSRCTYWCRFVDRLSHWA